MRREAVFRAGGLALVAACAVQVREPSEVERPAASATRLADDALPSVLLVTLDTTRADRMGAYGRHPPASTPTFDQLAAQGALFLRATSSYPLTVPSHASIMTGRFPPSHGVRDNGAYRLSEDAITLAERFHDAGYTTAAFTSAFPTSRRWGFDQGFDVYQDPLPHTTVQRDWRDQRRGDDVVDDAIAALGELEGPLFLWLHLFDAHAPYEPPEPYRTLLEDPYDGEIAFADAQVGRFLEHFRRARPRGIIAVTADHGEALGDGGEQTHGILLSDGTLHVPLVLAGEGVPRGVRLDGVVGHPDLAPTLLRLAGLPLHEGLQGRDLFQGGSEVVYSETLYTQHTMGIAALGARTDLDGRFVTGAWDGWYPYDPLANKVVDQPLVGVDLDAHRAEYEALTAALETVEAAPAVLDGRESAMLAALGYVGHEATASASFIDPRDVVSVLPLQWHVQRLITEGLVDEARLPLAILKSRLGEVAGVRRLDAAMTGAQGDLLHAEALLLDLFMELGNAEDARRLAVLNLTMGDPVSAAAWFERSLEIDPLDLGARAGWVRAIAASGDLDRAAEMASSFRDLAPDASQINVVLAERALAERRPERALAHVLRTLEVDPADLWALLAAARANWDLGRPDAAIDQLMEASRASPNDASLKLQLAEWLSEVGRHAEAIRLLRPLGRILPDDPVVADALAEVMRKAGR